MDKPTDRRTDQQRNGHTRWEGSVVEGGLFWGSLPGGPQPRHQKQHPPKGDKWHWLHGTWPSPIPGKAHLAGVGPHSQGWGARPQLGAKARRGGECEVGRFIQSSVGSAGAQQQRLRLGTRCNSCRCEALRRRWMLGLGSSGSDGEGPQSAPPPA